MSVSESRRDAEREAMWRIVHAALADARSRATPDDPHVEDHWRGEIAAALDAARSSGSAAQPCGWCEGEGALRDEEGKLGPSCPRCGGRSKLEGGSGSGAQDHEDLEDEINYELGARVLARAEPIDNEVDPTRSPQGEDHEGRLREIADLVVDVLHGRKHSGELLIAIKPYRTVER